MCVSYHLHNTSNSETDCGLINVQFAVNKPLCGHLDDSTEGGK